MSLLFTPANIGRLEVPNRLMRSATAECMADEDGTPRPELAEMYRALAAGGVGLIVSGHMYVHPSGKCHPEMTVRHRIVVVEFQDQRINTVRDRKRLTVGNFAPGRRHNGCLLNETLVRIKGPGQLL